MAVVLNGDACLRWLAAEPPNLDEARRAVERIVEEGTRAGEIVRRIRALSTKDFHAEGASESERLSY